MNDRAMTKESAEVADLREKGKDLGASFLPLSGEQADSIRAALIESIGTVREERSAARS